MNATQTETVECDFCGGVAEIVEDTVEHSFGRRRTQVEDEFIRCTECGEEYATADQMEATQMRAAKKIRREEGLLQPEEIRQIRDKYDLTQEDLEELIGAGPKTVTRWENGTVFQNAATDTLLRVLRKFPPVVAALARERGVEVHIGRAFTVYMGTYEAAAQTSTLTEVMKSAKPMGRAAGAFEAWTREGVGEPEKSRRTDIPPITEGDILAAPLSELEKA